MANTWECIGLVVDTDDQMRDLLRTAVGSGHEIGRRGDVRVIRWRDASGAGLTVNVISNRVDGWMPTFAGQPGARLRNVRRLMGHLVHADVVDEDGQLQTALVLGLEQAALIGAGPASGAASLVALGDRVVAFRDAEAFAADDESLLARDAQVESERPAHYRERGWQWPPRMSGESFISSGPFAPEDQPTSHARLYGTVLASERRRNATSDRDFVVVRARTAGFEVDLCLAGDDHHETLAPGAVIGGDVRMVGSLDDGLAGPAGRPRGDG